MINKPKGTTDYFNNDLNELELIINLLIKTAKNSNLKQVILPSFEEEALFKRTLGQETDVISKEMFTINGKGKNSKTYVLRPEGTASIARFIIENKLFNSLTNRYFYLEKMFRYERPQKGRQREFFQFGVEVLNDKSIYTELELILFISNLFKKLAINKYELQINTIGTTKERKQFILSLKKYLQPQFDKLSADSKIRFEKNILRILDSKDKQDLKLLKNAPKIYDFLTQTQKDRFLELEKLIKATKINYSINYNLVRGLDYYNDFVFEFVSTDQIQFGSNATIAAGGRYDGLINQLDSKRNLDAIGFALGVERLIMASKPYLSKEIDNQSKSVLIPVSQNYNFEVITLGTDLREKFYLEIDIGNKNLTKKIQKYIKSGYKYILLIGEEIKDNEIILKDIKNNTQSKLMVNELLTKDL